MEHAEVGQKIWRLSCEILETKPGKQKKKKTNAMSQGIKMRPMEKMAGSKEHQVD